MAVKFCAYGSPEEHPTAYLLTSRAPLDRGEDGSEIANQPAERTSTTIHWYKSLTKRWKIPKTAILPIVTTTDKGIENSPSILFTYKRRNAKLLNYVSHFEEFLLLYIH